MQLNVRVYTIHAMQQVNKSFLSVLIPNSLLNSLGHIVVWIGMHMAHESAKQHGQRNEQCKEKAGAMTATLANQNAQRHREFWKTTSMATQSSQCQVKFGERISGTLSGKHTEAILQPALQ